MSDDDRRSGPERAAHYRRKALDALLHAEMADEAGREWQREAYLQLAKSWHALAAHLQDPTEVPAADEGLKPHQEHRIT